MVKLFAAEIVGVVIAISALAAVGDDPLPTAAVKAETMTVGQAIPSFTTTDDAGQPWNSADHVGKKVLVMYFYPGDFTGGCTRQAQVYRDGLARIQELGVEVVGISGDHVATHKLFKQTYGLTHTLLADPGGRVANLFGIPTKAGGKIRATGPDRKPLLDVDGKRIDLERPVTLARWTAIVGRDGKIASLRSIVNPVTDAEVVRKIVEALPK